MKPKKSYIIWFTQRSGSTYLCELLKATGYLGKPGEILNIPLDTNLSNTYDSSSYEDLLTRLWREGSSPNGVFGVKFSIFTQLWEQMRDEIFQMKGEEFEGTSYKGDFLWDIFPNCQHIYLTRRNKIRQVVSWWKAIQNGVWHSKEESKPVEEAFYESHYNVDALNHLLKEIDLKESATEDFFVQNKLQPFSIVYEDLVRDPAGTVGRVINFLGMEGELAEVDVATLLQSQPLYKTSNESDEVWVQRFREDLQEGWDKKVW